MIAIRRPRPARPGPAVAPPRPRLRRALAPARLAAVLAALSIAAPPTTAAAQGSSGAQPDKTARDEAASRFKKGVDLFGDGDYQAALIEFRRAYELVPSYSVLYNIGQVQYQLQDYAAALATLERYLAEGGRQIPSARRSDVEEDIQKLKGRISQIDLVVNVPDAEVAVDDVPLGKGPFRKPLTVSAGRRKITVSREGYGTQLRMVDLASNDTIRLTFELVERGGAQPAPPPEGPMVASPTPDRRDPGASVEATSPPARGGSTPDAAGRASVPWVGWAATGAFAAGAAVFGALALGASSDLQDLRAERGTSADELSSAAGKTTAFAVVTDVLAGAALVAGGISLYVTLSRPSPSENATAARPGRPTIRVGVAPTSLWVLGTF